MSRLLEQVREAVRTRHYSIRTGEAYIRWVREYILFCGKRHPPELGATAVSAFISHLAVRRKVAASTQTQALSALLFLYREVLALPTGWVDDVERAKKPKRLPVVFTREEARTVLGHLWEEAWLMASLLYGSGLLLMECVRLRVKDVDLARLQLNVRDGKAGKDRVTVLPTSLGGPLRRQRARSAYPALSVSDAAPTPSHSSFEDDGVGCDPENTSGANNIGLGLVGLREWAALVGGTAEVYVVLSSPGPYRIRKGDG